MSTPLAIRPRAPSLRSQLRTKPTDPRRGGLRLLSGPSSSGIPVSELTAMQNEVVLACVRVVAETMGVLPWGQFTDRGDDRVAVDGPIDTLLRVATNDEMSAQDFVQTMMVNAQLWLNAYAEISQTTMGDAVAMMPIEPWRVAMLRDESGQLVYDVLNPDTQTVRIPADRMFHVKGLSFNGIEGMNLVSLARESIGLGLAATRFAAEFFGNSGIPGGVLEHPKRLDDPAVQQLREQWSMMHQGPGKYWKVAVLANGVTWKPVTSPIKEAQLAEMESGLIRRICGIFRVPPHMVGDMSEAKWANIEQQKIDFADSLVPWAKRFELEADRKLLGRQRGGKLYTKFNFGGLLRGDFKSRQEGLAIQRQWGIVTANEWRRIEDRNRVQGGDRMLVPLNHHDPNEPAVVKPAVVKPAAPPSEGEPKRRGADVAALRPIVEAAWRRILGKEANAVLRLAERDPLPDLAAWSRKFYAAQRAMVVETLAPIVETAGAALDLNPWADQYCDDQAGEVRVSDDRDKLRALAARWERVHVLEETERFMAALSAEEDNHADSSSTE